MLRIYPNIRHISDHTAAELDPLLVLAIVFFATSSANAYCPISFKKEDNFLQKASTRSSGNASMFLNIILTKISKTITHTS